MMDIDAYGPFPNAILFNWATIFVLGFGNLAALDFQARCMAARTPKIATMGNLIAAGLTFIVGITFSFLGGYMRQGYGPDSQFASFTVDTCSKFLDLSACAAWEPDPDAFFKLATKEQMPTWVGCWVLIGITAASMSTSDGAILAISTVLSHNVARKAAPRGREFSDKTLLAIVRAVMIPITLIACIVASEYNKTGYLLIVAFDISLAGCIAPLFAAVYCKKTVTPGGALAAVLTGSILRAILEYSLPKDGFLVIPHGQYSFDYGSAQDGLPSFIDAPAEETWDPDTCEQPRLEDWTGLDSLLSPIVATIVMFAWSAVER
ncbi:unnamed protein product [Sphacelaria rigidula]